MTIRIALLFLLTASCLFAKPEKKAASNSEVSDEKASKAFLAGDYDTAIVLYNEVIQANPKADLAYNGRGLAYRYKKDYAKALADLDAAIRLKPLGMFYFNRGVTYYETGNDKSAIADLTRAIRWDPADPHVRADCFVMRARCYIDQRESESALADLNAAIKADPKLSDAYRLRGIVHKVAHEYDKGVADCEKAIALDPKSGDAYNTAAFLLSVCPVPKYRDGAKAVRYATKACELTEWKDASFIQTLAGAYAESGDFDKAIEFQKRAAEMDRKLDNERLALYEKHQPPRDLNREEKAMPLPASGSVTIKLGEKLVVKFELDGEQLINPQPSKGTHLEPNSFTLDFHLQKGQRYLFLRHSFSKIVRVRCLARHKGQDVYFETDLLPIPPNQTNPELWSEELDELVLFDFHFDNKQSEKSITLREPIRARATQLF